MIEWLIIVILVGEIFIFAKIDRINFGTWITPFSLLAIPYAIVVMTAFFFAPTLGFISLYIESVLIWNIALFFFFLGGLVIALPLSKCVRDMAKVNHPFPYENKCQKLGLILAWITIFLLCCRLFASVKSLGWQQIGTEDFAKSYGYGWVGHFRNFSMGIAIFLIGTASRRNIFTIFTLLFLIALYLMYSVKSWIIIPILAGFIYRLSSGRFKLSITQFVLFLFLGFAVFNVTYLIAFGVQDIRTISDIGLYKSLLTHFISYLFSGVLGLSNVVQNGIANTHADPRVIFAPFLNLYSVVLSEKIVSTLNSDLSVISIYFNKQSNVHTFFGTILINLGVLSSIIYVIFSALIIYGLFVIAKITRSCWAEVAWVFFGAMLSLGWFEFYFWRLPAIEVPVYCAVLGLISWLLDWRYKRKWRVRYILSREVV